MRAGDAAAAPLSRMLSRIMEGAGHRPPICTTASALGAKLSEATRALASEVNAAYCYTTPYTIVYRNSIWD